MTDDLTRARAETAKVLKLAGNNLLLANLCMKTQTPTRLVSFTAGLFLGVAVTTPFGGPAYVLALLAWGLAVWNYHRIFKVHATRLERGDIDGLFKEAAGQAPPVKLNDLMRDKAPHPSFDSRAFGSLFNRHDKENPPS